MTPFLIERYKVEAFRLQLPSQGDYNGQKMFSDPVGQTVLWPDSSNALARVFEYVIEFEWIESSKEWVISNADSFTITEQ